ncbi:hypothetical protein [Nocardioides sp. BYT-33-1]|uniref:hypothetical protein n=1 Tax=Nocardioides sp. BYT-33-1 TaxID=3416952 RepID=UPI003F533508
MTDAWQWLTLAEVLVPQPNKRLVQQGWSPKCHAHVAGPDRWGVLKTTAIQAGRFEPEHNKELPETLAPKPGIEVQAGDLLITCAGPRSRCGVPALVRRTPSRLMMSGKMYRFRPDGRVDSRFLEYWLLSPDAQRSIDAMKTGISDSGLNLTHGRFTQLPVPVPSMDEQRRVVAVLEDHLSRLDAARDGLETALARSEALHTAGLWLATHNLPGARAVELQAIAEVRLGRQRSPKNHSGDRMRPYLRAANVDWDSLRLDDVKEMHFTEPEEAVYRLEHGDILLTEASGSPAEVGKSVLYSGVPKDVCFQNTLLRVRCHGADAAFVQRYLLAEARAGRFMPDARGVGINHLGRARLAALRVDLPSLAKQREAVERCADLISEVERLRSSVNTQVLHATRLRKALLSAAFAGKLTNKEPVDV